MDDEVSSMLEVLKIKDAEELFSDVPKNVRKNGLGIKPGLSEFEVVSKARKYASENLGTDHIRFLGCGIYDRIVPSSVDSIIGRTEFLTSYTPYQPEISQGMLQSLFEYQSLVSDLTGMDMTNSSMYDGFTALGEAIRMSYRINGRSEILVPEFLYGVKEQVINSYISGLGIRLVKYKFNRETGYIDLEDLSSKINDNTSAIVVENPNSLGVLDENVLKVQEIKGKALLISYVDPVSLGALLPPGEYGSDIVVAEGQQLGIHQSFGGPLLGILSFRKEYVRRSPGRLIGESLDLDGKRSFVMTLQTREQHIRREKAMSNICSNQALMAVAAASYLSILGPDGLRKVALMTIKNSDHLSRAISSVNGYNAKLFKGTFFSDVPVSSGIDPYALQNKLHEKGIMGAVPLGKLVPGMKDEFPGISFFSVTEKTSESDIKALASALEAI